MSQRGWDRIVWIFLFLGFVLMLLSVRATAQGMTQGHSHDDEVGQFYASWNKPNIRDGGGRRIQSCCSKVDCGRVEIVIRNGRTYVRGHFLKPDVEVYFPDHLHEHNNPDARESPDGFNHACLNASGPLCLVMGLQS